MELIHFERLPAFSWSLSCFSPNVIEHFKSYYAWKRNRARVFMYSASQYSPETEKLRRTNRFITRFESKIIRSNSCFKKIPPTAHELGVTKAWRSRWPFSASDTKIMRIPWYFLKNPTEIQNRNNAFWLILVVHFFSSFLEQLCRHFSPVSSFICLSFRFYITWSGLHLIFIFWANS